MAVVEGGENVVELVSVISLELAELDDEVLADVRGHAHCSLWPPAAPLSLPLV